MPCRRRFFPTPLASLVESVGIPDGHSGCGALDLAGLAGDLGFADQSHMGREVRRLTGLSPARLNGLIATHEAFWFYRLLDESLG